MRARWRTRLASVRVRITAAAVLVVGVALVAGSIALVVALRRSLTDDIRTSLELRAADVVSVLEEGTPPRGLAVEDAEDAFLQVVDAEGRVVASSPNLAGHGRVTDVGGGEEARVEGVPIDDDEFLVVGVAADSGGGAFTVLAGRTLEVVEESTGFVTRVLFLGVPVLLLVVGGTAWWLAGRALAPVEAIRAEVDDISAAELHRRVSEPATRDELARLAATMNQMLDRLERAQSRQRRFVSDASHELRSPVTTIRQHAEVALAHPDRANVQELAGVVLEEDLRLAQLVDDLLFLARADERRLAVDGRPVDLDDLVFEEADRVRATTDLRVDTSAVSAQRVSGDPDHLRRLLRNLVDNAARHARTTVGLALGVAHGAAVLRVDDDGQGVPEGERERIFERFVRLDEARARRTGGSGLGLAIVAEITRAHEGSVRVEASPLGGARFELSFPLVPD